VEAGKSTADEIADIVLLVKALSVEGNKDAKAEQLGVVMEKLKMLETAFVRVLAARCATEGVAQRHCAVKLSVDSACAAVPALRPRLFFAPASSSCLFVATKGAPFSLSMLQFAGVFC
jgi:hypothetical protein